MPTGGEMLRALRLRRREGQRRKTTIEQVVEAAGIDFRTLSDIERNATKNWKPSRETVVRILRALNSFQPIPVHERNAVLGAFGYEAHLWFDLPTETEIESACREWHAEYCQIDLPAYLITFTQRLLTWNVYAPCILGMTHNQEELRRFRYITIFDLAFNPQFVAASRIINGQEFLPKTVRLIKAEMRIFQGEAWYEELITQTKQDYPLFENLWDNVPEELPPVNIRQHGPVQIQHPHGKILSFQLKGTDFASDPRFRIVEYHPIDSETKREWNRWTEESS